MCKKLEISPSGRQVENKRTGEKFYSIDELITKNWCKSCSEAIRCRLVDILERNIYKK